MLSDQDLEELRQFRQHLHQHPELSGEEKETAALIKHVLAPMHPDVLLENVGGFGLVAIFEGKEPGPSLLVRTDMDALPIQERNSFAYRSDRDLVAHLCGHDGHCTLGVGLARLLSRKRPDRGRVLILFQPAEETGEGAARVLADPVFRKLKIDRVIGLHNLPGYPKNQVIVRDGPFTCASEGLIIELTGRESHAAEPEKGINPADAIMEIMESLFPYRTDPGDRPLQLVTVIHVRVGDRAFGTSPGTGVLMLTLRAETDKLLESLKEEIIENTKKITELYGLGLETRGTERFAGTSNDQGFTAELTSCARELGLSVHVPGKAFRWSEDVGLLIRQFGGGFFGLGAGTESPGLHNPNYDFPDDILSAGIGLFYTYVNQLQQKHAQNLPH